MPPLMIRCPDTGREFATGILVDAESFATLPDKLIFSNCPFCGSHHTLLKCDVRFVEADLPASAKLWSPLIKLVEEEE
jgi:hypothetical protein